MSVVLLNINDSQMAHVHTPDSIIYDGLYCGCHCSHYNVSMLAKVSVACGHLIGSTNQEC